MAHRRAVETPTIELGATVEITPIKRRGIVLESRRTGRGVEYLIQYWTPHEVLTEVVVGEQFVTEPFIPDKGGYHS